MMFTSSTSVKCNMANVGAISARSIHGCWTCRTRKKKCDEIRPACRTCVSLEFQCHGYGNRPEWMDNGPLQRAKAVNIKQVVSHTKAKRRKRGMLEGESRSPFPETTNEVIYSPSVSSLNYPAEQAAHMSTLGVESLDGGVNSHSWDIHPSIFDIDISDAAYQHNPFMMNSVFNNFNGGKDICLRHSLHDDFGLIPPRLCEAGSSLLTDSSTTQRDGDHFHEGVLQEGTDLVTSTTFNDGSPWNHHLTAAQSSSGNTFEGNNELAIRAVDSSPRDEIENRSLLNYLDEVFNIQYPFGNKQYRAWLFSTLRRVKSVYLATLALSGRHMQMNGKGPCVSNQSHEPNFYDMALIEMQLSVEDLGSLTGEDWTITIVEYITCSLQLVFCELFGGGAGTWRSHLLAAGELIRQVTQARLMSTSGPALTSTDVATRVMQESRDPSRIEIAIRVSLGSLIWFDIIDCGSTRSLPTLDLDHKHLLGAYEIDLGCLFGCTNRVTALILEVILLDNWRKEAERAHQLSIVELVKRGAKIEECLQQEIREHESPRNTSPISQTEITKIFAHSTLTYLHVVVSGAHPELPEIIESVSKTIAAFEGLTDSRLLRNLVWPFCVSGCLALEGQQRFFRDIVSEAEGATTATCVQALKIIENCWELRKTSSSSCDWSFVLREMGCDILLL